MSDSVEVHQVRLAKNQSLFRSINERVEKISESGETVGPSSVICECAIEDCSGRVEMSHEEYEAVRSDPTHFVVLPGHVFPEVEDVVRETPRYAVVAKFEAAGRVAVATDERRWWKSG